MHNKRKAQSLIQEYLQKYSYLEEKPLEAVVDPNITFTDYIDHWLEGKKSEIKHSTYSCVSLLAEMGWNLKKIQYWCGHKDLATTANIYMHFNRQQLNTSADDLAVLSEDCADLF